MTKTAKYSFAGSTISTDELSQIVKDARVMNATEIRINQSSYNEPPYGTSTTTTITFEQGSPQSSGEGY